MSDARRFPLPWTVEDIGATFVVRDHNGQAFAYIYFEEEPGWRSATKLRPAFFFHLMAHENSYLSR